MIGVDLTLREKYRYEKGQCYNTETGELINIKNLKQESNEEIQEAFNKYANKSYDLDGKLDYELKKSKTGEQYLCVSIKPGYYYTKVFRMDGMYLIEKVGISLDARGFVYTFSNHIYHPTNTIVVNGQNPSVLKMAEMCLIKDRKMGYILAELEKKEVIKRVKINGKLVIFFNPFLIASGGVVDAETYELFKNSIFNPKNNY